MDEGLTQHAPDVDYVLGAVHTWMTDKARRYRSGVIPLDLDGLLAKICRSFRLRGHDALAAVTQLGEQGVIGNTDQGWVVLTPALKDFPRDLYLSAPPAGPERRSLVASPLGYGAMPPQADACVAQRAKRASGAGGVGGMEESARNLARDFFPDLCRENGITYPVGTGWLGLAGALKQWQEKYEIGLDEAKLMMQEFVRHPQWCRQSRKPTWQVFLARREQLQYLVLAKKRRDPGARRFAAGRVWWSQPERHRRGEDYWLSRA
jgi:hypothetical protein